MNIEFQWKARDRDQFPRAHSQKTTFANVLGDGMVLQVRQPEMRQLESPYSILEAEVMGEWQDIKVESE